MTNSAYVLAQIIVALYIVKKVSYYSVTKKKCFKKVFYKLLLVIS